jgi:hypothetical protein
MQKGELTMFNYRSNILKFGCAQAVIQKNTFEGGKVDVVTLNLTKSQVADLNSYFSNTSFDEAREAIFQESIQAASAAMESLI